MLLDRVSHLGETKPWYGEFPTYYPYTLGVAGERFFREIKDNAKFLGTRCQGCNLTYLPPRIYCEQCFEPLEEWREVENKGRVHTYTVAWVDLEGRRLDEPVILALVEVEGAHGGLVHQIGEIKPETVKIGMEVEAVFKDISERTGSILDIKYFKPRTEA